MKKLIAILLVVVISSLAITGCLDIGSAPGFGADDLVAPQVEFVTRSPGEAPTPPTEIKQVTDWSITGTTAEESIYSGFAGVIWISAINSGPRNLYVYGLGMGWVDTSYSYHKEAGVLVRPGETQEVGVLPFEAPVEPGTRTYELSLEVAVQHLTNGAWYDYGAVEMTANTFQVMEAIEERSWSTEKNPTNYYNDVNSRISTEAVSSVVSFIQSNYAGDFNILQVCEAYDWVSRNVGYEFDSGDYWQSAEETMQLRTGDCEDHAILVASIVKGLGGNARVNIIEAHAFPTVFVGDNQSQLAEMEEAIDSFYWAPSGSLKINYLVDDLGYWMVIDTVGVPYVGGLPAESSYAETSEGQGTWTFTTSDYLITVDATGEEYSGLF